jgi:hypothetical protein
LYGTFTVLPEAPSALVRGVFDQIAKRFGGTVECKIRLSNAIKRSDLDSDARGMAIKLRMGEYYDDHSPDFLLLSTSSFVFPSIRVMKSFFYWLTKSVFLMFAVFLVKCQLHLIWRMFNGFERIDTLVNTTYFSCLSFAHGTSVHDTHKNMVAVKYKITPARTRAALQVHPRDADFLAHELQTQVSHAPLEWHFHVQMQPVNHRVEDYDDPLCQWETPWVHIATMVANDFGIEDEDLGFGLQHAHLLHRPVGIMNRVRAEIMKTMHMDRIKKM